MIEFPSHLVNITMKYAAVEWKLRTELALHGASEYPRNIGQAQRGMTAEWLWLEHQNSEARELARATSFDAFLKIVDRFKTTCEVESIFIGMILSAWAAIEVTLKEAFHAALQESRHAASKNGPLARINSLQRKKRGLAGPASSQTTKSKLRFASILTVREAYSAAFDVDAKRIDSCLADLHIDSLSLIRNLLVHNAGIPDQKFRDYSDGVPLLRSFRRISCKEVRLNGRLVRQLVSKAITPVEKLLVEIDRWLQKHP